MFEHFKSSCNLQTSLTTFKLIITRVIKNISGDFYLNLEPEITESNKFEIGDQLFCLRSRMNPHEKMYVFIGLLSCKKSNRHYVFSQQQKSRIGGDFGADARTNEMTPTSCSCEQVFAGLCTFPMQRDFVWQATATNSSTSALWWARTSRWRPSWATWCPGKPRWSPRGCCRPSWGPWERSSWASSSTWVSLEFSAPCCCGNVAANSVRRYSETSFSSKESREQLRFAKEMCGCFFFFLSVFAADIFEVICLRAAACLMGCKVLSTAVATRGVVISLVHAVNGSAEDPEPFFLCVIYVEGSSKCIYQRLWVAGSILSQLPPVPSSTPFVYSRRL